MTHEGSRCRLSPDFLRPLVERRVSSRVLETMKKLVIFSVILAAGWVVSQFVLASWDWMRFQQEIDAILQTPRALNSRNLTDILLKKGDAYGFDLDPQDIEIEIYSSDKETTISKRVGGRGLDAETRVLTLEVRLGRPVLWTYRDYALEREVTFTVRLSPSRTAPSELDDLIK